MPYTPPPSISSINQYGITDERLWTKDIAAEVNRNVYLTADGEVSTIHMEYGSNLYLKNYKLIVGGGGICQRRVLGSEGVVLHQRLLSFL